MPEGRLQMPVIVRESQLPKRRIKDRDQGPKLPFKVVQQRTHALVDGEAELKLIRRRFVGRVGSAKAKNLV